MNAKITVCRLPVVHTAEAELEAIICKFIGNDCAMNRVCMYDDRH